jgi:tRNA(adenine34) deaminase
MVMISGNFNDEYFMKKALEEAGKALEEDEIPVGAIIVCQDHIIGKGHNSVERLNDVTAHAEILAITAASNFMGAKYLTECKIYITLEPCPMCAAAIAAAQIKEVIYGAKDPKKGYSLWIPSLLHPKTKVKKEIFNEESSELLKNFFSKKRKED